MTQIRAIVVDDELLARQYLKEMLRVHTDILVVDECTNGFEAVKSIGEHCPDLVFLDIQMPKLDGFEVLELVEQDLAVVFVTAYDHYALKAFDAHAVDYLLKPFTAVRLGEAIAKVMKNRGRELPPVFELKQSTDDKPAYLHRIVVKDGSRVVVVKVEDVDYVGAEDDYISVHSGGESVLKHQTISSLQNSLDPSRFVRIHRSTIVNIERIDRIELLAKDKYVAILKDRTELAISRTGHKKLKDLL